LITRELKRRLKNREKEEKKKSFQGEKEAGNGDKINEDELDPNVAAR
jgi:hypothetical protein